MRIGKFTAVVGFIVGTVIANAVSAGDTGLWVLSPDESRLAYGSIKNNDTGEVNYFKSLSGHVSEDGQVEVKIDVTSVETNVEIRNERMVKYIFDAARPEALLTSKIDMAALDDLKPGQIVVLPVEGKLSLSGIDVAVETDMLVVRLTDKRVLVTTSDMIMMDTDALGVNAGLDKLTEIAGLSGITRVTPVAMHLVFEQAG